MNTGLKAAWSTWAAHLLHSSAARTQRTRSGSEWTSNELIDSLRSHSRHSTARRCIRPPWNRTQWQGVSELRARVGNRQLRLNLSTNKVAIKNTQSGDGAWSTSLLNTPGPAFHGSAFSPFHTTQQQRWRHDTSFEQNIQKEIATAYTVLVWSATSTLQHFLTRKASAQSCVLVENTNQHTAMDGLYNLERKLGHVSPQTSPECLFTSTEWSLSYCPPLSLLHRKTRSGSVWPPVSRHERVNH